MGARGLLVAAAAVWVGGCGSLQKELRPWDSVQISPRYSPALSTSPQCIDAAKRATYFCQRARGPVSHSVENSDVYACSEGERDFYRNCR